MSEALRVRVQGTVPSEDARWRYRLVSELRAKQDAILVHANLYLTVHGLECVCFLDLLSVRAVATVLFALLLFFTHIFGCATRILLRIFHVSFP